MRKRTSCGASPELYSWKLPPHNNRNEQAGALQRPTVLHSTNHSHYSWLHSSSVLSDTWLGKQTSTKIIQFMDYFACYFSAGFHSLLLLDTTALNTFLTSGIAQFKGAVFKQPVTLPMNCQVEHSFIRRMRCGQTVAWYRN